MNQNSVIKVLSLTLFIVAVTVGLAFLIAGPVKDGAGGRFALGLTPIILAEFLLGGMMTVTMSGDEQSARHLFGLSRIWYAWLYLIFTLFCAVLVGIGAGTTFISVLHILALTAIIILSTLGSAVADRGVASDNAHPADSTLSNFKAAITRLASRAQLINHKDFGSGKNAILKSQDNLRYVFVESDNQSSSEDHDIGILLQELNDKLTTVESDSTKTEAMSLEIVALCAKLDAAIKLRTTTLSLRVK